MHTVARHLRGLRSGLRVHPPAPTQPPPPPRGPAVLRGPAGANARRHVKGALASLPLTINSPIVIASFPLYWYYGDVITLWVITVWLFVAGSISLASSDSP